MEQSNGHSVLTMIVLLALLLSVYLIPILLIYFVYKGRSEMTIDNHVYKFHFVLISKNTEKQSTPWLCIDHAKIFELGLEEAKRTGLVCPCSDVKESKKVSNLPLSDLS